MPPHGIGTLRARRTSLVHSPLIQMGTECGWVGLQKINGGPPRVVQNLQPCARCGRAGCLSADIIMAPPTGVSRWAANVPTVAPCLMLHGGVISLRTAFPCLQHIRPQGVSPLR